MSTYTLDPERNNEGGGLMAAGILKGGELVAIADYALHCPEPEPEGGRP